MLAVVRVVRRQPGGLDKLVEPVMLIIFISYSCVHVFPCHIFSNMYEISSESNHT